MIDKYLTLNLAKLLGHVTNYNNNKNKVLFYYYLFNNNKNYLYSACRQGFYDYYS